MSYAVQAADDLQHITRQHPKIVPGMECDDVVTLGMHRESTVSRHYHMQCALHLIKFFRLDLTPM